MRWLNVRQAGCTSAILAARVPRRLHSSYIDARSSALSVARLPPLLHIFHDGCKSAMAAERLPVLLQVCHGGCIYAMPADCNSSRQSAIMATRQPCCWIFAMFDACLPCSMYVCHVRCMSAMFDACPPCSMHVWNAAVGTLPWWLNFWLHAVAAY